MAANTFRGRNPAASRNLFLRALKGVIQRLPAGTAAIADVLYRIDLERYDVAAPASHASGWCTDRELLEIFRHPEARSRHVYKARLAAGHQCFFIRNNDHIASYAWAAFDAFAGSRNQIRFGSLQTREVFCYDLYTYRAQRRHGFGRRAGNAFMHALKARGLKTGYGLIDVENIASMKLHIEVGWRPVRVVYAYRIGSCVRVIMGPDDPSMRRCASSLVQASRDCENQPK